MSDQPSKQAILKVLEHELTEVQWMAQHGADSELKAAASLRVLKIEREIEEVKTAA